MTEVDNIVALRAYTPIIDALVYVKRYYAGIEGGGGLFMFKEMISGDTESIAENYGTIILPNSNVQISPAGRWVRQYSGHLNITYFGVIKAKSTTLIDPPYGLSNAGRINTAIDYITLLDPYYSTRAGDLSLYFPSGSYWLNAPIVVKIAYFNDR